MVALHRVPPARAALLCAAVLVGMQTTVLAQLAEPNRGGDVDLRSVDPIVAQQHLRVAEGYAVNLFASEQDFPLENPVAMAFDARGRLWVATMPSYPQYNPPELPNDKLLILEDTSGDGRADRCTVFADGLYLPTGFELGDGGVYVAQQPNLLFLQDTDGDDVADVRRVVLHGFGTEDSHHAISAFTWGPDGALYFQEGTFHHTQVETPYGPVRLQDAGVFRYRPDTHWLEVFVSYPFANPWGHVFDRWGQNFIADASGGSNYFGTAITGHLDYPHKHPGMRVFTSVVRPTCGCEIVRSRHFPDEAQGDFLVNNCIGFQGIKQHRMIEEGSGFTSQEVAPLLQSTDINFRPVDIQFGPDGALYIVDWFNPLIGHMQYSLRDERRDHGHGRVWRITYPSRPLVEPPRIAEQTLSGLIELLKSYEDRTRYRARISLREHPRAQVAAALADWVATLDEADADYERHLLEALWACQTINHVEPSLLARVLASPDYHARAAAVRVLRYWRNEIDSTMPLLAQAAADAHPRVRLEAVLAASFVPQPEAAEVALSTLAHPSDYYLEYVLRETMRALEPQWKPALTSGRPLAADNPAGIRYMLDQLPTADLEHVAPSEPVYVALLTRHDAPFRLRARALTGLAELRESNQVDELLSLILERDGDDGAHAAHVMYELGRLLVVQPVEQLRGAAERLRRLAAEGRHAATRQIGFAALVMAEGDDAGAWQLAQASVDSLRDFVLAAPLLPDAEARRSLYPRIEPLLAALPAALEGSTPANEPTRGRYIRIELPGPRRTLTLAEVEVLHDGTNVARSGSARQHSTSHGGEASRAIDGDTSGEWGAGGQTHTRESVSDPWWELDLGSQQPIESIRVWNRTDGDLGQRLAGFTLSVLDEHRHVVFSSSGLPAPAPSATFELSSDPRGAVRRAAMEALAQLRGRESDAFRALAPYAVAGPDRAAALRGLSRIPTQYVDAALAPELVAAVVRYLEAIPAQQRTEPDALDALQLGQDLANLLPTEDAQRTRRLLRELGVNVVLLRAVPHKMVYDRTLIAAEVGRPVEIVFENGDVMPHNLIVTTPGALAEVGEAAERMATEPDAFARHFIPDLPAVLEATPLVQPGHTARLQFTAPSVVGEYPFVCTFPGHWKTMNGTLVVVDDLEAYLESNPLPEAAPLVESRSFVQEWTYEELAPLLAEVPHGRSFERGQELFRAASCAACHRLGNEGTQVGPNLAEMAADVRAGKVTPRDVLREIVEPSRVIKEAFRTQILVTAAGEQLTGVVVSEQDGVLELVSNPLVDQEPLRVPLESIEQRVASPISLMPTGLLNTFSRDEILDLLTYVLTGGDARHAAYSDGPHEGHGSRHGHGSGEGHGGDRR